MSKKVLLIPYNYGKNNVDKLIGKSICILEAEDLINQVKIMTNEGSTYILAIDNSGLLHSKKIKFDFKNKKVAESEYKCFSCAINSQDNSSWSIDCFYPFVVVGGNNKCILIHNIEDKPEVGQTKIYRNAPYIGNKHNVPYVSFSPKGEFITCASIDKEVKIWDNYSGKLLTNINNKTKEW